MIGRLGLLAAIAFVSAGAGGGFALTYSGGADGLLPSPASASEGTRLSERIVGRILAKQGCSQASKFYGPDYVAELVNGQLFVAASATYDERDGLLVVRRDVATEFIDVSTRWPRIVAVEVEGVTIKPRNDVMRDCDAQSPPRVTQDDLDRPGAPSRKDKMVFGTLLAMGVGDRKAVEGFVAKGVEGGDEFNGKPLRDWATMVAPTFAVLLD